MSQFSDTDSFSDTSEDVGYDFEDDFLIKESEEDDVSSMASSGAELDPTHELSDLLTDMTLEERELHHNPKPRDRHSSDHFPVDYAYADPGHGADVEGLKGLPSESENTEDSSSEYTPSGSEYSSSENDTK